MTVIYHDRWARASIGFTWCSACKLATAESILLLLPHGFTDRVRARRTLVHFGLLVVSPLLSASHRHLRTEAKHRWPIGTDWLARCWPVRPVTSAAVNPTATAASVESVVTASADQLRLLLSMVDQRTRLPWHGTTSTTTSRLLALSVRFD